MKEEKIKSLDEKLQVIKSEVDIMKKNKDGYGYSYVDEESILLKINSHMIKLGIKLTPQLVPGTLHTEVVKYVDKKKNDVTDILVTSEMEFIWKDITTGETIKVPWGLVGQQSDGSQAFGSGLTYSNRYFLLKYFNISTSQDDPDELRKRIKQEEEQKKMTAEQTKVKKLFAMAITKFGKKELVYEKLGTTREQFVKDYEDTEKCKTLLEQFNLLFNEKKEKDNA
jgi:hypothetical protein